MANIIIKSHAGDLVADHFAVCGEKDAFAVDVSDFQLDMLDAVDFQGV
jgi:hypothetical protein